MKNSQDILSASNKTKAMWDIVKKTTTSSRYLVENVVLKDNERETNDPEKLPISSTNTFLELRLISRRVFSHKIQHLTLPKNS